MRKILTILWLLVFAFDVGRMVRGLSPSWIDVLWPLYALILEFYVNEEN